MPSSKKEKKKSKSGYTLVLRIKYNVADLLSDELNSSFGLNTWQMQVRITSLPDVSRISDDQMLISS